MLIAVVALTALCVIGIGALVYFKLRDGKSLPFMKPDAPAAPVTASPSALLVPSLPESAAVSTSLPPAASAAPTAVAVASTGAAVAGAGPHATVPAAVSTMKATSAAIKDPKEEFGYLTIVCNPYCDDVLDQGKSLGPSPVVHVSVKPGQHRITLKKGNQTKVISVIVEAGQVAAQRVTMTK